jgi:hypothetical protein
MEFFDEYLTAVLDAAEHIVRGWETQAGRPASDVRPPRTHRGDTSVSAPSLLRHGLHPVSLTKHITRIR